jgi:hypothetical protein
LDFFAIVTPQTKAHYIADLDWLHRAHPLMWHFQNTADGHKALMADGVLCEFAVFTPDELAHATFAPRRRLDRRRSAVKFGGGPDAPRQRRAAGSNAHGAGVCDRVFELAAKAAAPNPGAGVDPFNPDRRIERRCP